MSDQWDDHDAADDLLEALLFAHAGTLRNVIGDALDVDAGLTNVRSLRGPVRQTEETPVGGEPVEVRAEPASRTDTAGEGNAVEQLVATLRHEKRQVIMVRERLHAVGPAEFGAVHSRRVANSLRSYSSYLGGLARDFASQTAMHRDTVLQSLSTHRERLRGIRLQCEGAATGTDRRTQREWRILVLLVEERADVLLDLYGTIEWLFENSDDRQEVNT
ncbi:hypothetical protein OG723_39115 [Streptomyces sp. NBC_01278]|uniref:hypothetical protein n=1 Tax=unclassified Streptomyces TaxID=2593676 RepID=UPI002E37F1C2|nr:hypothetical protein [Streptomyces sp. NBC_01278]